MAAVYTYAAGPAVHGNRGAHRGIMYRWVCALQFASTAYSVDSTSGDILPNLGAEGAAVCDAPRDVWSAAYSLCMSLTSFWLLNPSKLLLNYYTS